MHALRLGVFFAALICGCFAAAQTIISNGEIGVNLNEYGRIRVIDGNDTNQLEHASILLGVSNKLVFDYLQDADNVIPADTVQAPLFSDLEVSVTFDNSFNNLPPAILAKLNIFLWNSGGYMIARFVLTNNEVSPLSAVAGMEILPRVDNIFGAETIEYLSSDSLIAISRGNADYTGYKLLNGNFRSLKTFEWFDSYNETDDSLYKWLTYDQLDPAYTAGLNGAVAIPALAEQNVPASDSILVYVGIATGADQGTMLANMSQAIQRFQNLFVGIARDDSRIPNTFALDQNFPNPFNPTTRIGFTVPTSGQVQLVVYNIKGQKVQTLINSVLSAGGYEYTFAGHDLPSGIYFYTLTTARYKKTLKMALVR